MSRHKGERPLIRTSRGYEIRLLGKGEKVLHRWPIRLLDQAEPAFLSKEIWLRRGSTVPAFRRRFGLEGERFTALQLFDKLEGFELMEVEL